MYDRVAETTVKTSLGDDPNWKFFLEQKSHLFQVF